MLFVRNWKVKSSQKTKIKCETAKKKWILERKKKKCKKKGKRKGSKDQKTLHTKAEIMEAEQNTFKRNKDREKY